LNLNHEKYCLENVEEENVELSVIKKKRDKPAGTSECVTCADVTYL
jgi:hypothetical protein